MSCVLCVNRAQIATANPLSPDEMFLSSYIRGVGNMLTGTQFHATGLCPEHKGLFTKWIGRYIHAHQQQYGLDAAQQALNQFGQAFGVGIRIEINGLSIEWGPRDQEKKP